MSIIISDCEFVVFSDDWGRHPSSCQHIFKYLLKKNNVLWVNTIGMRIPRLSMYDFQRVFEKIIQWTKPGAKKDFPEKFNLISPFMLPTYNNRFCCQINNMLIGNAVKKKMKLLKFRRPVVITTIPIIADLIGKFNEILSVYYCVDEFSQWPGMNKDSIIKLEKRLLKNVDLVIATSEELLKKKSSFNSSVHYLPHGVDLNHFRAWDKISVASKPIGITDSFNLSKPCIGFFGLVDDRINQDVFLSIARKLDCNILIIGTIDTNIDRLKHIDNIFFTGQVPYENLPYYIKLTDALILPYKLNSLTININPLKLLEYMATEKPVFSAPLPEVRKYSDVVNICEDAESFAEKIGALLKNGSPANLRSTIQFEDLTWKKRAEQFSIIIQNKL